MIRYCTGERYKGEFNQLAIVEGWHGLFGHINVLRRDHDSVITGFGKHERVVCFQPDSSGELYCRVDHVWNLDEPVTDNGFKVTHITFKQ